MLSLPAGALTPLTALQRPLPRTIGLLGSYRASLYPPPQILQPSKRCHSEPRPPQRLANSAPSEDPCDSRGQPRFLPQSNAVIATCRATDVNSERDPAELHLPFSSHLKTDVEGFTKKCPTPGVRQEPATPHSVSAERPAPANNTPGTPQTPRLFRRVLFPAPPQEGATWGRARRKGKPDARADPKTLPPPTRGLPCFSSGPQPPPSPALHRARLGLAQRQSNREASGETEQSPSNIKAS
ncbi:hypothetical protein JZ751_018563, partial [Albula glossodonta]